MIATSELRLGNWVYDGERTQFPMYVQTIGEDYVYLNFNGNEGDVWECKPEDLQGIPITAELLTKLGFSELYGLWRRTMSNRRIAVKIDSTFVSIEAFEDRLLDSRCTCHGIEYLHQLQNLFKAISNDDLKIDIWK